MFMSVFKMDFESLNNCENLLMVDNGESMHKWVTTLLDSKRSEKNILYRVDKEKDSVYIYIQSDAPIIVNNIKKIGMKFVKQFELRSTNGRVMFKLRCHPTHNVGNKRMYILNKEDRLEYVKRYLSDCLDIENVFESSTNTNRIKENSRVTFCDFVGTGTVKNADLFMAKVQKGIGKCKCYGAGMLMFKEL